MKKIVYLVALVALVCTSCKQSVTAVTITASRAEEGTTDQITENVTFPGLLNFLDAFDAEFQGNENAFVYDRSEYVNMYYSNIVLSGIKSKKVKSMVETAADEAVKKAIVATKKDFTEFDSFTFRVLYTVDYPTHATHVYDIQVVGWGK